METYLNIALIVLAVTLIAVTLLQGQGGGLGSVFGEPMTIFRTKRGIERTLFQLTIVLAVLFVAVSIMAIRFG